VGTRSILGVSPMRKTFLDNLPAAESRKAQAGRHTAVIERFSLKYGSALTSGYELPRLTSIFPAQLGREHLAGPCPRCWRLPQALRNRLSPLGISLGGSNGGFGLCQPGQLRGS
jgi:hypothetical protein